MNRSRAARPCASDLDDNPDSCDIDAALVSISSEQNELCATAHASNVRSADAAGASKSSKRKRSSNGSSRSTAPPTKLARARGPVGCKENVFNVLQSKNKALQPTPTSGRGSGSNLKWYHSHWQPSDQSLYCGTDLVASAKLRNKCKVDNADMDCKHCGHKRKFNPTTYFRDHLLISCPGFPLTEAYKGFEVQKDLASCQVCFRCPNNHMLNFCVCFSDIALLAVP